MNCDREDLNNNDQEDLRDILRNIVQPKFIKLSDVEVKIELMEESEARMLAKFFRSSFIPTKVCSKMPQIVNVCSVRRSNENIYNENTKWLAWHGTPLENVESILLNGLLAQPPPGVETKVSCFGPGIYGSRISGYSVTFCKPKPDDDFFVVFIIEIDVSNIQFVSSKVETETTSASTVFVHGRYEYQVGKKLCEIQPNLYISCCNPILHSRRELESSTEQLVVRREDFVNIRGFLVLKR